MCTTAADLRATYAEFLNGPGRPGALTAADPVIDAVTNRERFEAYTQLRLLVALASDDRSISLSARPAPGAPPNLRLAAKLNIVDPRPQAAWTAARAVVGPDGLGGITSAVDVSSMTQCVTELTRSLFVAVMDRNSTTTAGYWNRIYRQSVLPYIQTVMQQDASGDRYEVFLAAVYKAATQLPNAQTLAALMNLDPAVEPERAAAFEQVLYATHLPYALYTFCQRNATRRGGDYYRMRLSSLACWLYFMHVYQCLYQYTRQDPDLTDAFSHMLTLVSNAMNDEGSDQLYAAVGQARAVADDNRTALASVRSDNVTLAENQRRLLAAKDEETRAVGAALRARQWTRMTLALAVACLTPQIALLISGRRHHAKAASAVSIALVLVFYAGAAML